MLELQAQLPDVFVIELPLRANGYQGRHPTDTHELPQGQIVLGTAALMIWLFVCWADVVACPRWVSQGHT